MLPNTIRSSAADVKQAFVSVPEQHLHARIVPAMAE
jgi:hypothetical protein